MPSGQQMIEREYHGRRVFRTPLDISRANLSRYVVDEATGCHVWQGAKCDGYAMVGVSDGVFRAARLVYVRDKGPIPHGLVLDHLCRNRACINSEHLEAVTNAENVRRGDKSPLTWEIVREMRRKHEEERRSAAALGREYGVNERTVRRILHRETWQEEDG